MMVMVSHELCALGRAVLCEFSVWSTPEEDCLTLKVFLETSHRNQAWLVKVQRRL